MASTLLAGRDGGSASHFTGRGSAPVSQEHSVLRIVRKSRWHRTSCSKRKLPRRTKQATKKRRTAKNVEVPCGLLASNRNSLTLAFNLVGPTSAMRAVPNSLGGFRRPYRFRVAAYRRHFDCKSLVCPRRQRGFQENRNGGSIPRTYT
jgi:hypothetical protein